MGEPPYLPPLQRTAYRLPTQLLLVLVAGLGCATAPRVRAAAADPVTATADASATATASTTPTLRTATVLSRTAPGPLPLTPGTMLPASHRRWIDSTIGAMSLRDRVAQTVMVWVLGDYTNARDPGFLKLVGVDRQRSVVESGTLCEEKS